MYDNIQIQHGICKRSIWHDNLIVLVLDVVNNATRSNVENNVNISETYSTFGQIRDIIVIILFSGLLTMLSSKATNQVGMPASLAFPDKGLPTVITNSNTDASGNSLNQDQISSANKLRYLDKTSGKSRTEIRNLRNALITMTIIKDKLALTDALMERSAYYYRKALDRKLIKGRSITEVVVASIYAQKLEISPSIVDASAYISRIADNANVNQKTYKRAVEILDEVNNDPLSHGKDPKALATAVLYSAQIMEENDDRNHDKISQTRMAKAGGISIVTLRKRASDVLRFCKGKNS